MDEYISRGDVLDIVSQYCPDDDGSCSKAAVDTREMLDEIEALPSADVQSVNQWISCKDKMPEDRTLVLFCYVNEKGLRSVHYGYHFNINGITAWAKPSGGLNYCDEEITHWQPLPEPPKQRNG